MPRRSINISRNAKRPSGTKEANTTAVISFLAAIVETLVGKDEDPSPLLKSLIKDMNVDEDDVEVAQDITLLAVDIMKAVSRSVDSGSAASLPFELVSIVGPAIPEIQADIERLKD